MLTNEQRAHDLACAYISNSEVINNYVKGMAGVNLVELYIEIYNSAIKRFSDSDND